MENANLVHDPSHVPYKVFVLFYVNVVWPLRPHSHEAWRKLLGSYSRLGALVMKVGTKSDVRMLVDIMYGR